MLAPELVKGGMIVGGQGDFEEIKRFGIRLKGFSENMSFKQGIEDNIKIKIQKELDLNQ